jgi:hypothetical protein
MNHELRACRTHTPVLLCLVCQDERVHHQFDSIADTSLLQRRKGVEWLALCTTIKCKTINEMIVRQSQYRVTTCTIQPRLDLLTCICICDICCNTFQREMPAAVLAFLLCQQASNNYLLLT